MRWIPLLLAACGTPDELRGNPEVAELVVCSPEGGRQVLVAASPEAFPEDGALLEDGCTRFELAPGTWFIQVSELTCEGPWEEVEVTAPVTEHTADFGACLA